MRKPKYPYKTQGLRFKNARAPLVMPIVANSWSAGLGDLYHTERPELDYLPAPLLNPSSDEEERNLANFVLNQGFSQRSGKTARSILSGMRRVYETDPQFFDPRYSAWEDPDYFFSRLHWVEPFAHGQPERIEWWAEFMQHLRDYHNGDAREFFYNPDGRMPTVYDQVMDIRSPMDLMVIRERIIRSLSKFRGVKHKIASLIAVFMQQGEWQHHAEFWKEFRRVPFVPADLHHMRLTYMLGLVEKPKGVRDYRDKIARPISDWLSWCCAWYGVDHIHFSQAMYNVGASIHFQYNMAPDVTSRRLVCAQKCPFNEICVRVVPCDRDTNTKKLVGRVITRLSNGNNGQSSLFKSSKEERAYNQRLNREFSKNRNRGSMQWDHSYPRTPAVVMTQFSLGAFLEEDSTSE